MSMRHICFSRKRPCGQVCVHACFAFVLSPGCVQVCAEFLGGNNHRECDEPRATLLAAPWPRQVCAVSGVLARRLAGMGLANPARDAGTQSLGVEIVRLEVL